LIKNSFLRNGRFAKTILKRLNNLPPSSYE
jgi:hypothetical protein